MRGIDFIPIGFRNPHRTVLGSIGTLQTENVWIPVNSRATDGNLKSSLPLPSSCPNFAQYLVYYDETQIIIVRYTHNNALLHAYTEDDRRSRSCYCNSCFFFFFFSPSSPYNIAYDVYSLHSLLLLLLLLHRATAVVWIRRGAAAIAFPIGRASTPSTTNCKHYKRQTVFSAVPERRRRNRRNYRTLKRKRTGPIEKIATDTQLRFKF